MKNEILRYAQNDMVGDKMTKIKAKALSLLALFGFSLFTAISCGENAGLGSSVDTEAPKISILYPPEGAIIRENFEFSGTWSDDKTVTKITVTVSEVISDSQKEVTYTEDIIPEKDGSWKTTLNTFDKESNAWQFADGNYEISAVALDGAGNYSGTASHSYAIDNTAPVLVLTKPTSIGSNTPKTYGRTVQLEGTFSEACSSGISKLTVSFFDENGNGICDSEFENITDMSNANPLVIAQFFDKTSRDDLSEENQKRWENYKAIYTDANIARYDALAEGEKADDLTQKLFFTVTATDAAKIYRDSASGAASDNTGNATASFYRNTDDMSTLINSKNTNYPNFTVLSLRNYLNGTDNTYAENEELAQILKNALSASVQSKTDDGSSVSVAESAATTLNFSINPQNNPTFSVSGLVRDKSGDAAEYEDSFRHYFAGSAINVSIAEGLDGTKLDTSTISIYYRKVDSVSGDTITYAEDEEEQLLWTWNKEVALAYAIKALKKEDPSLLDSEAKSKAEELLTVSVASAKKYRYTITAEGENSDALVVSTSLTTTEVMTGCKYLFSIVGKDINEQEIISSATIGYGFFAQSNSSVPEIYPDSYDSEKPNANKVTLTAFTESDFVTEKLSYSGYITSNDMFTEDSQVYYLVTVTDSKDSDPLKAKNISGLGTIKENSTATMKVDLRENTGYIYDFSFTVTPDSDVTSLISSGSGLYTVDVVISATNGGGESNVTRTYYLDTKKSDFSNVSLSVEDATSGMKTYLSEQSDADRTKTYYVNNESGTFKLAGTVTDNYKIGTTSYKITGKDASGAEKMLESPAPSDIMQWTFGGITLSDFAPQSELPDALITITTTDNAGNEETYTINLEFDTTLPSWNPTEAHPYMINKAAFSDETASTTWFKDSSLPVSGCYTEAGSGVSDIYYWVTNPAGSAPATNNLSTAKGSFKATNESGIAYFENATLGTFEANDSEKMPAYNTLYLVAVDNVGNRSQAKEIQINLDTQSPTLSASKSGIVYTNKVSDVVVTGTCDDNASGVASITLKANGYEVEATLGEKNPEGKVTWTATLKASADIVSKLGDESYNVNAIIQDNAGNKASSTLFILKVDTVAPPVSVSVPAPSSTINGKVKLQGSVSSDGANPTRLKLYYSTSAPTTQTTLENLTAIENGEFTGSAIYGWSIDSVNVQSLSGVTADSPSQPLYIIPVVYDEAGNCNIYTETVGSEEKTYSYKQNENYFVYTVDQNTDRPVITLSNIASGGAWVKTNTLQGLISDDDGTISSLKIGVKGKNATTYTDSPVTVSNGSWTLDLSGIEDYNDIKLKFEVTDAAGKTFSSSGSTIFDRPYYLYSETKVTDAIVTEQNAGFTDYGIDFDTSTDSGSLSIKLDTKAPSVLTVCLDSRKETGSFASAQTVFENETTYKAGMNSFVGGDFKYVKFYVPIYDANSVTPALKITNAEGTEEFAKIGNEADFTPSTYTTTVGGITYTYYESRVIDVSTIESSKSGARTVSITVTDESGNVTVVDSAFTIDNLGPDTIEVTSPSSTESLTGDVEIFGAVSDNGVGTVDSIEWAIPLKGVTAPTDVTDWISNDASDSDLGFNFKFTTGDPTTDLTIFDKEDIYKVTKNTDDTYTIPVYFRAKDTLGNVYYKTDYFITHNPDGDRPVTELSYPIERDYDINKDTTSDTYNQSLGYVTLSGKIQVTGSVEIPALTCEPGVVYLQIGKVTESDIDWVVSNFSSEITAFGGSKSLSDLRNAYASGTNAKDSELHYNDSSWWGIPCTLNNSSWSIILNNEGNLNPTEKDSDGMYIPTAIAIRACAVNDYGKLGIWTAPIYIHVDSDAPTQSAELRQYSSFDTTNDTTLEQNVTTAKNYASGMYLRKTWYLVATIDDNDSIEKSSLNIKRGSTRLTENTDYYTSSITGSTDSGAKQMKVYIPIETTAFSMNSVSYTLYVTDNSGHASSMTYSFYIDNDAPEISTLTGDEGASTVSLIGATVPPIQNYNYHYNISSAVNEPGSGFDKFFFYFLRENTTTPANPRILDTLIDVTTDSTNASALTSTLAPHEVELNSGTINLYGKTYSGELDPARTKFTATSSIDTMHIRKGGLICIGGEYQVIKEISGNTVSFTTAIPESVTVSSAFFPYGYVVDSMTESTSYSDDLYANGDGDGLCESIKKSGTVWNLTAAIKSDFMSDGPVKLICLAFDKAGNISAVEVSTHVQNNAPRLAKLHLGTDLNGDGTYSDAEFNTYTFVTADSTSVAQSLYKQEIELATAADTYATYKKSFTIKDGLAIVPEITGGNGGVKMAYLKDSSTATTYRTQEQATAFYEEAASGIVTADFTSGLFTNSTTSNADITKAFVLTGESGTKDTNLYSVPDGTGKAMSFTFWDSTDGTVCGKDSNYCFVRVTDFTVDLVDEVPPHTVIDPFYWKTLTDNSIYGSKDATRYDKLQGHIELEDDLSEADKSALGSDPKVSGKITFKGYAYDDQRLTSLWVCFDGFTPINHLNSETTTVDGKTYYKAASYSAGTWTAATATMANDDWCFAVDQTGSDGTPAYLSQSGHKVFWTLSIDTEKISTVAAKDVNVRVVAQDRYPNTTSTSKEETSKTDEAWNVPYYQMDVVPYITGVTTSLSSMNENNPTIFSRTTNGHYPVYMTMAGNFTAASATRETLTLTGFNLTGGIVTFANDDSKVASANTTGTKTANLANDLSFTIPNGAASGHISVSVKGVSNLNNTNNNEAHGSYECSDATVTSLAEIGSAGDNTTYNNFYNRQPNGANNNRLTDDVYIDVWQFNSEAVIPTNNSALDIMMKINPANGLIGFAFCNGDLYFAMPNWTHSSQTKSYESTTQESDFFECTAFYVDGNGYSYAAGAPGQSNNTANAHYADLYYFYGGYWEENKIAIDRIAVDSFDNMAKDRFKSPSIVATKGPTTGTDAQKAKNYAYITYFDLLTGELRFLGGVYDNDSWGTIKNRYTSYSAPIKNLAEEHSYVQVVANTKGNGLGYSGEYVSIGIADGHVVMVWYDAQNGNLEYAYATNTNFNPETTGEGDDAVNITGWSKVGTILSDAGKYCQLAVDSDNHIHIACYDSANGDLKYVYLDDYTGASKKTCTVDSYLSVGKELTIDVAKSGSYQIPYIGYYGSTPKKPRYAYLAEPEKFYAGSAMDGVSSDMYTGVWECSIVPSNSTITVDATRRINVGVWKNSSGVLKNSTTGASSSSAGSGTVYGNGTSNAVLGYGVRHSSSQDYGETAQKR